MSWNIDKVKEIVSPLLEKDEEILSIGLFRAGPPWWLAIINPGDVPLKDLLYVCITTKQIYSIPVNVGDFETEKLKSHTFDAITLNGNELLIKGSEDKKPARYQVIGTPQLAGVDMEAFRGHLKQVKSILEEDL